MTRTHFAFALPLLILAACSEGPSATSDDGTDPQSDSSDDWRKKHNDAGTAVADSGTKTNPTGTDASTVTADGGVAPVAPGSVWQPTNAAPIHWAWQLSGDFVYPRDVRTGVTVYDIDGETATAATVAQLHAIGPNVKVICYFDAGVYEDYRSDKASFPKSIIGSADIGWPGSFWLDIRQLNVLMPILKNRINTWCKNKGFDAIEPDETEVWSNNPGFPITLADNVAFHKAISDYAHSIGLSVGLKGNNTEAGMLEPLYDWALTEECYQYDECNNFKTSFLAKGKAVFDIEYKNEPKCADANAMKMNSARRDLDVLGPTASKYLYHPCIPDTQNTW